MFTKLVLVSAIISISLQVSKSQNFMKSINENAPVKCTKSIVINANTNKVWQVLTNINQWAEWQSNIPKAKLNGPLQVNTTFDWKTGGAAIHSILHTVQPNQYFGWTGKTFGMFAIHNWSLQDINGQTKVVVEESMEGFLAKLFKKSFNKNLEKDTQAWLEMLKKESEK